MYSMKLCSSVLFFVLLKCSLSCAFSTQYYGNTKHPVLPLHCYYEDLELAVPLNQTILPTNIEFSCIAITCRDDYVLLIKHCDRIMSHHHCRTTSYDYSKAYPDCCSKVICE